MKDYGYVLREYEQNSLDVRLKFYKRDCHSVITAQDLASVQFYNGCTFSENGSELAFDVMKKVRQIEDFIKQNPQNEFCKRYVKSYQDVCQLGYSKAENAARALAALEDEIHQEQSIIFSEKQIGKATVDAPTTKKSEAQRQVTKDEQEIEQGEKDVK